MKINQSQIDEYRKIQKSPLYFIEKTWGLTPERDNTKFVKGKHITWQQHDILLAVERAIRDEAPKRISIRSGHGVGKTSVLSWLQLWYLFSYVDAQVPCTAPTSEQMYDVLWKESYKWLSLMPEGIRSFYDWSSQYIRIKESPNTWFSRARTSRKEQPEALAGIHGDYVLMLIDEASGIADEIFNTAEGALTNNNYIVVMPSNPTRLIGYFYDSHHKDKINWQTLAFSCLDSPLVDKDFVERIKSKNGEDSDEYKIRVLGEFPQEDAIDNKGYVPLFLQEDIRQVEDIGRIRNPRMGVDCAGEGVDKTVWVIRDAYRTKIVASEKISTPKGIAQKTATLMDFYNVLPNNVTIDNFGIGANVAQELAIDFDRRVYAVNVGEKPDDERFLNRRAEAYTRLKEWTRRGGEFTRNEKWNELLTIRYQRSIGGKIKIMSKQDMRREGYGSPDYADALMLTFVRSDKERKEEEDIGSLVNIY